MINLNLPTAIAQPSLFLWNELCRFALWCDVCRQIDKHIPYQFVFFTLILFIQTLLREIYLKNEYIFMALLSAWLYQSLCKENPKQIPLVVAIVVVCYASSLMLTLLTLVLNASHQLLIIASYTDQNPNFIIPTSDQVVSNDKERQD